MVILELKSKPTITSNKAGYINKLANLSFIGGC